MKRGLAQTRHKNRFIMGDQTGINEHSVKIQEHQYIYRRTRKTGQWGERFGFKRITRRRTARIEQGPNAFFIHPLAQRIGRDDQG